MPTSERAVVVTIFEGKNKPYHDNKVKNGADKRKIFDNSELTEMMSECDNFTPDTTAQRSDVNTIKLYLMSRFAPVLKGKNIDKQN